LNRLRSGAEVRALAEESGGVVLEAVIMVVAVASREEGSPNPGGQGRSLLLVDQGDLKGGRKKVQGEVSLSAEGIERLKLLTGLSELGLQDTERGGGTTLGRSSETSGKHGGSWATTRGT